MSHTVYIMRHGIAEDYAASGADADRRLTDEGRRRVVEIAHGLKALDVKPSAIVSSPFPRALETATLSAAILAKGLDVETDQTLATDYDAEAVVAGLDRHRDAAEILLVGHQPQLGELASLLMTGSSSLSPLPFKKGGVAAIEVDTLPPRGRGALLWFVTPKQLRALA